MQLSKLAREKLVFNRLSIPNSDYPYILRWEEGSTVKADVILASYLEILLASLLDIIGKEDELASFNDLPLDSKNRICSSPETYVRLVEALRSKKKYGNLTLFLKYSIGVEHCRNGIENPNGIRRWSANGDLFFDVKGTKSNNSPKTRTWHSNGCWIAPELTLGIPIDYASIFITAPTPVAKFRKIKWGKPIPLTQSEADFAVKNLQTAFTYIRYASPSAAQFLQKYVSVIMLRNDPSNPFVFQSASRNSYIGQIALLNCQLAHIDIPFLAESLVHESIHSLMWRAEILCHFLNNPTVEMENVISPWSGRELHFYTFIQACFVWYGVLHFWRNALENRVDFRERAEYLYERARKGFIGDGVLTELMKGSKNLQKGMVEEIEKMVKSSQQLTAA